VRVTQLRPICALPLGAFGQQQGLELHPCPSKSGANHSTTNGLKNAPPATLLTHFGTQRPVAHLPRRAPATSFRFIQKNFDVFRVLFGSVAADCPRNFRLTWLLLALNLSI